jgi:SPP1 gp7 family putative phage head morphogenesis protein
MKPLAFEEAIAWAQARKVVLPDVYYGELQGFARSTAFSVAGMAKLDQLQRILDSLGEALREGETFAKWKKAAERDLAGLPPHRIENIFRTNIQGAYGRGRCEQQARVATDRPYLLYDAVNDSRTRPSHAAMDGFVARRTDPIFGRWRPPSGYQCRCRVIALTEAQARPLLEADQRRLEADPELAQARKEAEPDPGWNYDPCTGLADQIDEVKREKRRKAHPALEKAAEKEKEPESWNKVAAKGKA